MLWTLILILLILWALGFGPLAVAGSAIHLLLVIILILFIWQVIAMRSGPPPPP